MKKKRIAFVGASLRSIEGFARPLLEEYGHTCDLVGVVDRTPRKTAAMNRFLGTALPGFENVEALIDETRPDTVIIGTMDATHAGYIESALARGVQPLSEKPLCINASQCRQIRHAQASAPSVIGHTAHNLRYDPHMDQLKRLLDQGTIGQLEAISFCELLDRRHGANFFRRWHRRKENSGGLLVHKASHCFDLMNGFAGSRPATVVAEGSLQVYGPAGSDFAGERCSTCRHAEECPQFTNADTGFRSHLYFENRKDHEYTPDLCVFSPEIDIEDWANVTYTYENGVRAAFHLCTFSACEGVQISLEGSMGRIEYREAKSTRPVEGKAFYGNESSMEKSLRLFRFDQKPEDLTLEEAEGGHGGADPRMLEDLFSGRQPSSKTASLEDGIQAVLVGIAANQSIAEGRRIDAQSLLP